MELKLITKNFNIKQCISFNRTFMELKFGIDCILLNWV